jgi:hypothetical protein
MVGIGVSRGVLGAVACGVQATSIANSTVTWAKRRYIDCFMNAVHLCEKIHSECITEIQNAQLKSCVYLIVVHQIKDFFVLPAWCFWHRKAELQRSSATDLGAIGLVA